RLSLTLEINTQRSCTSSSWICRCCQIPESATRSSESCPSNVVPVRSPTAHCRATSMSNRSFPMLAVFIDRSALRTATSRPATSRMQIDQSMSTEVATTLSIDRWSTSSLCTWQVSVLVASTVSCDDASCARSLVVVQKARRKQHRDTGEHQDRRGDRSPAASIEGQASQPSDGAGARVVEQVVQRRCLGFAYWCSLSGPSGRGGMSAEESGRGDNQPDQDCEHVVTESHCDAGHHDRDGNEQHPFATEAGSFGTRP